MACTQKGRSRNGLRIILNLPAVCDFEVSILNAQGTEPHEDYPELITGYTNSARGRVRPNALAPSRHAPHAKPDLRASYHSARQAHRTDSQNTIGPLAGCCRDNDVPRPLVRHACSRKNQRLPAPSQDIRRIQESSQKACRWSSPQKDHALHPRPEQARNPGPGRLGRPHNRMHNDSGIDFFIVGIPSAAVLTVTVFFVVWNSTRHGWIRDPKSA